MTCLPIEVYQSKVESLRKSLFNSKEEARYSLNELYQEAPYGYSIQNTEIREVFSKKGKSKYIIPNVEVKEVRREIIIHRNQSDVDDLFETDAPFETHESDRYDLKLITVGSPKGVFGSVATKSFDTPEEFIWDLLHPEKEFDWLEWQEYLKSCFMELDQEKQIDMMMDVVEETSTNSLCCNNSRFIWSMYEVLFKKLNEKYFIKPLRFVKNTINPENDIRIIVDDLTLSNWCCPGKHFIHPNDLFADLWDGFFVTSKIDAEFYVNNPRAFRFVIYYLENYLNHNLWCVDFMEDGKIAYRTDGHGRNPDKILNEKGLYYTYYMNNEEMIGLGDYTAYEDLYDFEDLIRQNKYTLKD